MTLWQLIVADLEPLSVKERVQRRRLWTPSLHDKLAEDRDENGRVIRDALPRSLIKARTATVRYLLFWDAISEAEL